MQEEYGIKLKILTDGLKNSVAQVKGMIHRFTDDIKQDTDIKITINPDYNINKLTDYKNKIESMLNKLKEQRDFPGAWAPDEKLNFKIAKYEAGLKAVKERIAELGNEADDTKQKMSGISVSANMSNKTIVNGFKDSWRSIKKFAFALLSVRGIFGLIRKASSSYMTQDTQLAKQMQKTWASLGALMAPIIETIVKWIRIAAAYINYFVKALTGKDLIGKATKKINAYNKSIGGTAKSAKSLKKELTSLDEVTNLSFDDASTTGIEDAGAAFDDFKDIKLDKKVTDMLDSVAKVVKKVGEFLKPVIDWAKKHPDTVLKILGGALLLKTLTKLVGGKGLLATLAGNLGTLATIGVVVAGVDLIYNAVTGRHLITDLKDIITGLKELHDNIDANTKQSEENTKANKKRNEIYEQGLKDGKKTNEQYKKEADFLLSTTKRRQRDNDTLLDQLTIKGMFNGANKKVYKQEQNNHKVTYDNLVLLKKYNKEGKLTVDQKKDYQQALVDELAWLDKELDRTDLSTEQTKKYKKQVKELKDQFEGLTGRTYNAKVDVSTKEATEKVNALTHGPLNILTNGVWKAKTDVDDKMAKDKAAKLKDSLSAFAKKYSPQVDLKVGTKTAKKNLVDFIKKSNKAMVATNLVNALKASALQALLDAIPAYDVGTPYVPNDQLAMVHKGEAIIPKKFNNAQTFSQTSDETNALLVEVNQNLIELRNRPNILAVNGRELAQATYNDYQNEGNRLNQSMTIKRSGN